MKEWENELATRHSVLDRYLLLPQLAKADAKSPDMLQARLFPTSRCLRCFFQCFDFPVECIVDPRMYLYLNILNHFDMLHTHLFHAGLVAPSRANAMISWT